MKCPKCGFANRPGARYCKQCGQALPAAPPAPLQPTGATCPACGAAVKPGARFCPRCGRPLTAEPAPPEGLEVHIEGGISGQLAIGNNILQIGNVYGGVVNVAMPEEKLKPRPRPTPVSVRPRPFPNLLDRETEIATATAALQSAIPVELHGQPGLGKTSLLRHLAHHPTADDAFPDGVVYLSARRQSAKDVVQSLYDAFYESDTFKPTRSQARQSLQGKQALILLDDVELPRDEVEALMDFAPSCTFLLGSPQRCLWGEGQAIGLRGLPPDDALALVERELGRSLAPQEQIAAQAISTTLKGHPLRILQAAAMAREEGLTLDEVAYRMQAPSPVEVLTAQILASLSEPERRVLATLAVLGDAPLHTEHLSDVAGLPNVIPVLETLQQRGLVQAHSPRYSLTGDLGQTLQQTWNLAPWAERILAHFTSWAEGQQTPDRLVEEADAILRALEWATGAGRWAETLRLGRAVEGALALGKRWSAWVQVLRWILQAARALKDQAAEAWALHQSGTRALCLGDTTTARAALTQALRLRKALGDKAGAAITRHNLSLLLAPPTPPKKPPKKPPKPPAATGVPALVKGAIALVTISLLALGGGGIWYFFLRPTPTPVEVTATPTPRPTQATATRIPTPRPTRTSPPPTEVPPIEVPVEEPWVIIELADGCYREYIRDDQTVLFVETNTEGRIEIWLDDTIFEEIWLAPGEVWEIEWAFENLQSGGHAFWTVLLDTDDDEVAWAECPFDVTPLTPTPITPSPTPSITPSPTSSITPSPTPDTTGPTISNITESDDPIYYPSSTQCPPDEVTISASISDPSGVSAAKLTYRVVDESYSRVGEWQALAMNHTPPATYAATVGSLELESSLEPPSYGPPVTLEYYIQAYDGENNRSESPTSMVLVNYCLY